MKPLPLQMLQGRRGGLSGEGGPGISRPLSWTNVCFSALRGTASLLGDLLRAGGLVAPAWNSAGPDVEGLPDEQTTLPAQLQLPPGPPAAPGLLCPERLLHLGR